MMYQTKISGYSEGIATVIDGRVILNWSQRDVGELAETLFETSMMTGHIKESIFKRFAKWFRRQNAIEYERTLPTEFKNGSLAETMKGLE